MLFDTHLHTKFSADSKMSIENAILSAKQQNIGLVLTEHLDYDKHTVYLNYLNTMIKLIKQHDFANILGHVDYICRYAPYAKKDICYEEFHDTIDTLWQTIIDKGIVPELNTRRFDNSNNISILLKLYERYAMLGGKYVSIGSDAHKPENIGFAFKEAYALLDRLNLQPVYFVNRQMQLSKI